MDNERQRNAFEQTVRVTMAQVTKNGNASKVTETEIRRELAGMFERNDRRYSNRG